MMLHKEWGSVDLISHYYLTWSGRLSSLIYFTFYLKLYHSLPDFHNLMLFNYAFTLSLLVYSVSKIIRFILKKYFQFDFGKMQCIAYSILFIGSFYFFTFQSSEVWWWFCSSFVYLQSIVFLLFGVSLVLSSNKKIYHYLLISFCFAYAGSGSEIYTIIILSLLLFLFLFSKIKKLKPIALIKKSGSFKAVSIAVLSFCISGMICLSAPGNYARLKSEEKNIVSSKQIVVAQDKNEMANIFLSNKKYIVALALSFAWFFLGRHLSSKKLNTIPKPAFKKITLLVFSATFISMLVPFILENILFNTMSIPIRAYTLTSFLLTLNFCLLFFALGYKNWMKSNTTFQFLYLSYLILIVSLLVYTTTVQFNICKQYANAYDNLLHTLIDAKKTNLQGKLTVQKLPDSGVLIPLYIEDKYMSENIEILLELPYKIECK
ncbi:MAG: hypothetical protein IPM51_13725 [Sphingobacteriaceae bacterium]|nr:hypothetical protein [Sphingobacteriaceae bacterium]